MTLRKIYNYLEDNVTILYHLHKFSSFIDTDIIQEKDKIKTDIEKAIFSIIDYIKDKRIDWMDNAYDIIARNCNYIAE